MFSIMKSSKYCYIISAAIILIGIIFLVVNGGFATDIDFSGGCKMVISTQGGNNVNEGTIKKAVESCGFDFYGIVNMSGDSQMQVKTSTIDSVEDRVKVYEAIKKATGITEESYLSCENISATLSTDLLKNAILALVVAVAGILIYIYFRFEFAAGVAAVIALLHDSLIMISVYAIFRFTVNSTFVAAILTIVGYSVNATIVVFDRIRENRKYVGKSSFEDVCEKSIRQTLRRTVNTTITTLISLIVLYILGAESVKAFALPLIIGVLVGTYSSIMLAAPLWKLIRGNGNTGNKKAKKA
ncbi:MAG: protein translocase subunit SecF [Clostridia bacterium]|nr:protein translocase subunit SecF [Clostridia bacterium]